MTTEEKFEAIIRAQVDGGCDNWIYYLRNWGKSEGLEHPMYKDYSTIGDSSDRYHILEILLDPRGLLAAYAGAMYHAAHQILDTWLSTDGDAAHTIHAAFLLLPCPTT